MKRDPLQRSASCTIRSLPCDIRAVCLLPGLTDIVTELGQSAKIVANSHECSAQGAVITVPKLPVDDVVNSSLSLDELSAGWSTVMSSQSPVGCNLHAQLSKLVCSFYYVDIAKLAVTKPTVVFTILPQPNSFLEPSMDEIIEAIKLEIPSVQEVHSINPSTLSEVFAAVYEIARVLKCREAASRAVADAKNRLQCISRSMQTVCETMARKERPGKLQRIAIVQWTDPIYLAGDWIPEVVEIGGGLANMFTRPGGPSITISEKQLLEFDIIVFAICAVGLNGCRDICKKFFAKHSALLRDRTPRFIGTDATILFSRPSLSSVLLSAEVVSEIVADSNTYGHRNVVWSDLLPESSCG